MPDTVTAWPYNPDPRSPGFSIIGYGFGMVPPTKFLAKTTGALSPYQSLNDGVLLTLSDETPPNTTYLSGDSVYRLFKVGHNPPLAGPPIHSVSLAFSALDPPAAQQDGLLELLFPDGIQVYTISTVPAGGPPNLIPNPLTLTPRNFSATA